MYAEIKKDILGEGYSLSVAFVSTKKSKELNKKYRRKDKPTNVLSFALHENEGELILCKEVIQREARSQKINYQNYLLFLVIHGMLHLKGMIHSSKMDKAEKFYCKKYGQKYFGGHRRGLPDDSSRRGRISKRRNYS